MLIPEQVHNVFVRHGTDKAYHRYGEFYAHILNTLPPNPVILELGVHQGSSIKAWNELVPGARIFGVDINPGPVCSGYRHIQFDLLEGDFRDLRLTLPDEVNLIIDDAHHIARGIERAWAELHTLVAYRGWYVVEDLEVGFRSCGYFSSAPGAPEGGYGLALKWVRILASGTRPCGQLVMANNIVGYRV